MAYFKAKLALYERRLDHALVLEGGKKQVIWYADPASDLTKFLAFATGVIETLLPW